MTITPALTKDPPFRPLRPAVRRLLALHSLEAHAPSHCVQGDRALTLWTIRRIRRSNSRRATIEELGAIDHLDSVAIVQWALSYMLAGDAVPWDHAPYTEAWRRNFWSRKPLEPIHRGR